MKKYILTSQTFTGSVLFGYDDEHSLLSLLQNETNMDLRQRSWLVSNLPRSIEEANQLAKRINGKLIQLADDITFETFWNAYDKKINLKRAKPMFEKLKDADKLAAVKNIKAYDAYLQRIGIGKAHPDKYIRNEYYSVDWNRER